MSPAAKKSKPRNVVAEARSGGKKQSSGGEKWLWDNVKSLGGEVLI